jgi:serine protease Do
MKRHEDNDLDELEDGEKYQEPSLEDFLIDEEDDEEAIKSKKQKTLISKMIAFVLVIALLSSIFGVWVKVFNLPSFEFLQKSSELSKEEFIQEYKGAVVSVEGNNVKGTGFNISADGKIITNYHIIETMNKITVSFPDGQFFNANVISSNKDSDFALLEIEGNGLPSLSLEQEGKWQQGDPVFVVGNPLAYTRIAIDGVILESDNPSTMRIEALIHQGNSGSPVINENGNVIGIVYAKMIPKVGQNDQIVGLAIPIEVFNDFIE